MFHIHVHTKKSAIRGPDLMMDCPSCPARRVIAKTADITAQEYLYWLIPVTTTHYTTITCTACNRSFRSPLPCRELAKLTLDQFSELVAVRGMAYVGNITKFCVCVSVLLGIMPVFGLGCAIVGVIGTHGCRTRWRTAALIGLAISIVSTAVFIWSIVNEKHV